MQKRPILPSKSRTTISDLTVGKYCELIAHRKELQASTTRKKALAAVRKRMHPMLEMPFQLSTCAMKEMPKCQPTEAEKAESMPTELPRRNGKWQQKIARK